MAASATRYDDPSVLALASSTEQQLGLPSGLLTSIITKGERSNSDQVSSAGARTVAQITPATRALAIKAYGVDPYLSTQNAVEVAGNLLKDSLDRNNGNVGDAIAEYHGGTDRANWGPITNAYVKRVTAGIPDAQPSQSAPVPASQGDNPAIDGGGPSTFDRAMAAQKAGQAGSVANTLKAYQSGQMTPEDAKAFEDHVNSGSILLPQGASLNPSSNAATAPAAAPATVAPPGLIQAYQSGQMTQQDRQDFESLVKSGQFSLPTGVQLGQVAPSPTLGEKIAAIPGAIAESFTGAQRRTPTTDSLPDYATMPELNQLSAAGIKTGLGTMTANPQEIGQIIQANFPSAQVSHDEKGNTLITSSIDGKTYAVKPGFQPDDILRAGSAIAAFTPAGRAETVLGSALGSGATQAAIEGTKAASGGNFDASNVGIAALTGGVAPLIAKGLNAVGGGAKALLTGVRGAPDPIAAAEAPAAASVAKTAPASMDDVAPVTPVTPPAPIVPLAADDLAATARQAATGDKVATQTLAQQAAPDAATVASAKRLGVEDYLQPDHVTTNQVYREIAQAVKSDPGSATRAVEMEGLGRVGQRASSLIDELGGTNDLSSLSQGLKSNLQGSATDMEGQADRLWAQLRTQIRGSTQVNTPATTGALKAMVSDLGGEVQAMKALPPSAKKMLGDMMSGEPVSYGYLDNARKQIGAAIARQTGPFADMESGTLNHLYGTLSHDQENIVAKLGGDPYYTFQAAKYATRLQKGFEDDLSSLFGKNLDRDFVGSGPTSLPGALASASKGDASGIARLLSAVPPALRERVVTSGIASTFRNAKGQGDFNFNNYANWYEGLQRNRQSYAAVMSNLPLQSRKMFAALYNVSKGVQLATRERITTGRITAVKDMLRGTESLMDRMYGAAKNSLGRVAGVAAIGHFVGPGVGAAVGSALTTGAKPEAIKAVDALISSPEFATAVAKAAQDQAPQAAKELGNSAKFRKFVSAAGSPAEMSDRQRWILQALQANNSQGNH